jgi:hypothetical protein
MAEKYVRCNSHCKYPAYDKEEVDALLSEKANANNIYEKGNFVVLEHTIPIGTLEESEIMKDSWSIPLSVENCSIKLPDGFTPDNTMILSAMWKENDGTTGNGMSNYWTTKFKNFVSVDGNNFEYEGLQDVSINKYSTNSGENNRLWFDFQYRDTQTNQYPIYLKFLIMKVE